MMTEPMPVIFFGHGNSMNALSENDLLTLLYVLALRRASDRVTFPVEGFDGGSVSMLSVRIG